MHDYPNLMTIMRMRGKSRKDCAKAIGCNRTTLYKKLRGRADWRLQECLATPASVVRRHTCRTPRGRPSGCMQAAAPVQKGRLYAMASSLWPVGCKPPLVNAGRSGEI